MDLGERTDRFTVLIRDRAGQFTDAFDAVLASTGIMVAKSRAQSPGERACRAVRAHRQTEFPDRMLNRRMP